MDRVIVYIDGFNLYYGIRSKGWKRYLWINLQNLSRNILKPDGSQTLIKTKYFTTRISTTDTAKIKRQNSFLDALSTLSDFDVFYGHYLLKDVKCNNCGTISRIPEEKKTDVCIATEMIFDAFNDMFDTAILVSGDGDLVPPVRKIIESFPHKRIGVAFPPDRKSDDLAKNASYSFMIRETALKKSLFPDSIKLPSGFSLTKPALWI